MAVGVGLQRRDACRFRDREIEREVKRECMRVREKD